MPLAFGDAEVDKMYLNGSDASQTSDDTGRTLRTGDVPEESQHPLGLVDMLEHMVHSSVWRPSCLQTPDIGTLLSAVELW